MDPTLEYMARSLVESGDYRVTSRLEPQAEYHPPDNSPKLVAAVVDVETTGTNPESDKIIELGICLFEYDRQSGRIYRVLGSSEWLEDPGSPIPPEITNITGITDEMVAGHPAGADLSCLSVAPGQSGSRPRQRRHTDVWTCHFVPG